MLFAFFLLVFLLVIVSHNLLLTLLLLEMLGFIIIYYVSLTYGFYSSSDYLVLFAFSILVMEGVIALCGLIILVSYSGSDYLVSSSLLKI